MSIKKESQQQVSPEKGAPFLENSGSCYEDARSARI